jgi:hypothetical protein
VSTLTGPIRQRRHRSQELVHTTINAAFQCRVRFSHTASMREDGVDGWIVTYARSADSPFVTTAP